MAELQSGEGRMMIDSDLWAQYINVTDTQTATQPRPIAIAAKTHCIGWQKRIKFKDDVAVVKSTLTE